MSTTLRPFLTAEWLHLAVLNFEIDPAALAPLVPRGTEIDTWHDTAYVSVVGFLFRDTRVWGLAVPFHRHFEEVNLRFYVRRKTAEGWRRGVVFVKELAPRALVCWTARLLYGENYCAVRMGHDIQGPAAGIAGPRSAGYWWRTAGRKHAVRVSAQGEGQLPQPGSLEEFILEQEWGYAGDGRRTTVEYRVEHPRWKLWTATEIDFDVDVRPLYGERFVESLSRPPASAFLVDGSRVTVYRGVPVSELSGAIATAPVPTSDPSAASRQRYTDETLSR